MNMKDRGFWKALNAQYETLCRKRNIEALKVGNRIGWAYLSLILKVCLMPMRVQTSSIEAFTSLAAAIHCRWNLGRLRLNSRIRSIVPGGSDAPGSVDHTCLSMISPRATRKALYFAETSRHEGGQGCFENVLTNRRQACCSFAERCCRTPTCSENSLGSMEVMPAGSRLPLLNVFTATAWVILT